MTGRLPGRSELTRVMGPRSTGGLPAGEITIAETLKPLGYSTACVGKWRLGRRPEYLPTRHGFDGSSASRTPTT
jgi:arylsulfatase A